MEEVVTDIYTVALDVIPKEFGKLIDNDNHFSQFDLAVKHYIAKELVLWKVSSVTNYLIMRWLSAHKVKVKVNEDETDLEATDVSLVDYHLIGAQICLRRLADITNSVDLTLRQTRQSLLQGLDANKLLWESLVMLVWECHIEKARYVSNVVTTVARIW